MAEHSDGLVNVRVGAFFEPVPFAKRVFLRPECSTPPACAIAVFVSANDEEISFFLLVFECLKEKKKWYSQPNA